jgi:predicted DNA-binding transcriptional regulator YafY
MPLNKEALIRYRVINRCLVGYKFVSKERLIRACEEALDIAPIGERTIDQDLHDMREDGRLGYYAPIRFSREKNGYYYEDPGYSIDHIPINEDELEALSFASTMLDQYKNIEIFSTFSGAVQKIVDAINIRRLMKEESSYSFIQFDKAPLIRGSEYLEAIIRSIREKQAISMEYRRFTSEKAYLHIVHPYLLKEYRNRWYLIGLNHELDDIRTYGLDRIISISPAPVSIGSRVSDFNPASYFRSTIGISVPHTDPVRVILKFTLAQAQYIITQPLHESQEIIGETSDHLTFSLFVTPTYEFISMILGWGPDVEVLEPAGLRAQVRQMVGEMKDKYH